ncbi:hypothetical protein NDK43_23215 [Neobacillus pocheonensis]|uniref:Aminotransferase class I/classII domain-containing protein n=1 Tax=Neobacillus pocheonensis TaxID=363869 RepID=A0ABT0WEH1_9BACI|nr:hypothetical protein [Neobacillus pocheonensis]
MIGVLSDKDVIEEFANANLVTSRARWSNVNRGCMNILANIYKDETLLKKVNAERQECNALIAKRADAFIKEANQIGLKILPYHAGFFITIPCDKPDAVSELLIAERIFVAPLLKGIRVAACSVPVTLMYGLAAKIQYAIVRANSARL